MPIKAKPGSTVDDFMSLLTPEQQAIAALLRDLVAKAAPKASVSIKWGMPVWEENGMLCYIAAPKGCINFGFYEQGTRLTDPDGLLEGTGKNMRHVKLVRASDVKKALFTKWVKEAVAINRSDAS